MQKPVMFKRTTVTALAAGVLVAGGVVAAAAPASANGGIVRCHGNVCAQLDIVSYVDVIGNSTYAGIPTVIWRGVMGGTGVTWNIGHAPAALGRHFHVLEIYMWHPSGGPRADFYRM